MSASEITLCTALSLFNDRDFRADRAANHPNSTELFDARAATFTAMSIEGRFEGTTDRLIDDDEHRELFAIAETVIKLSNDN